MASTLRQLAKAYANSQIDKEKYRNDRTAYVEAVVSGKLPLRPNQHDTALLSSTFSGTRTDFGLDNAGKPTGPTYISTDDNAAGSASFMQTKKTGLIIGAASLVVIIIVVFIALRDNKQQAPVGNEIASSTTAQADAPPSAAHNLIRSFLDTNIWSQASMDNFRMEWNRLSEADRTATKSSIELGQMTNAIYKKLLEEKALSGIGNPETSYEKQRILVQFASDIGIDDPRISLPELPEQAASITP